MINGILTSLTAKLTNMDMDDVLEQAKSLLAGEGITDATEEQLKNAVWEYVKGEALKKFGIGSSEEKE